MTFSITSERPFGIYLYDYFAKSYELVTGNDPADFRFISGVTPLSTFTEVSLACIAYYALILGGQSMMKNVPEIKAKALFQLHNFALTAVSLALALLFVEQMFPILYNNGLFYAICNDGAWTQKLELLYYLNNLVKYWEFLDTMFLVLRKKQLEFLHWYHHSMTAALCFSQLIGRTSVSWVPITLNLIVHVFMYYYYFRAASGARIWWKKYLTSMQIGQFIADLVFVYFCTYTYFSERYFAWMPNAGSCAGHSYAAVFGCVLLSSYLLLFIQFFKKTYSKGTGGKVPATGHSVNGKRHKAE
uniref:very-long-chain 3-oxoacyl-CoA synthase n=1 Tax=Anthurium amnicola TaxID=1678845 RepID=A0A1D1Z6J7_9ARAE